jgi:ABC-2 type transport system ATP-binding protein
VIDARDVVYRYAGQATPALAGINLQVREGSLFGLLGPNGSGKTTLISILTGILSATGGTVRIGQLDLPAHARTVQRFSSLVPQENAFYPTLTVAENLNFFASVQDIPTQERVSRIDEALHITGLEQTAGIRSNRLSGGMKRRLSIALGLLNHPRVLFLDEPTVGIDPQSRQFLLDAIKRINAQGTTVVYCSHYMEEVEFLCDEVAILDGGRVLKQGTLVSLLDESRLRVTELPVRPAGLQELFFSLTKRDLRDASQ